MAKKTRAGKTKQGAAQKSADSRRKFISKSITVVGGLAIAGVSYGAYKVRHHRLYDLSVIGNGTPTVVQVHDSTCPKCRQLKANLEAVKHEFKGVQFRTAPLNENEGAELARKYGVGKVTLLVFDGDGELIDKLQGIYPEEQLRKEFSRL